MNSLKGISRRNIAYELLVRLNSTSTATTSSSAIQIPPRIERGPTDILKALEGTIAKDPGIPSYKFIDSAYTIPYSTSQCRTFAMARESGKKTAMWIYKKHYKLFQHKEADPPIKAFMPRPLYKRRNQVSEKILLEIINEGNVESAIQVYNLLRGEVSIETKQNLLELLCFFNAKQDEVINLPIMRWYMIRENHRKNTWSNDKLIQELHEFLITQDAITASKAHSAVICGMAKYFDVNKANTLYMNCNEKNIPLSVDAYNYMIELSKYIMASDQKVQSLSMYILKTMYTHGVKPNIHTLNSVLSVAYGMRTKIIAVEYIKHILKEFKALDIHPCLASYYYILKAFQNTENLPAVFTDILDVLEGSIPVPQDENDCKFFPIAMSIACSDLMDINIASRLHKLYLTDDSAKFITSQYNETVYYRSYITLKLNVESFDDFFTFYKSVVPYTYIPEPKVMINILHVLSKNTSCIATCLPQLWSHMVMFDMLGQDDLISEAIDMMYNHCLTPESPIHETFGMAAETAWNYIQETSSKQRLQTVALSAPLVGNIAMLLARAKKFVKMSMVIRGLLESRQRLLGELSYDHVMELFRICILDNRATDALNLMEYVETSDTEYVKLSLLGKRLYDALELTEEQKAKLISLVGETVLSTNVPDNL